MYTQYNMEYAWLGIPGIYYEYLLIANCKTFLYVYLQLIDLNVCVFSIEMTMAIIRFAIWQTCQKRNH